MLCSVVKHVGSGKAQKKCKRKHETQLSVFPYFLSALATVSQVFYNRTEHSRGFFICFMIKNPIISPHIPEFSNQTLFSKGVKVASVLYCSQPIALLVRIVQII